MINLKTKKTTAILHPFLPANRIDDASIDGNLLFTLDAEESGYISVYTLDDPSKPKLLSSTTSTPVGPYAGISAKNGNIVVSGGTKYFAHRTYDKEGKLSKKENQLTRDQGHPDVLLSKNGNTALISTHFEGTRFGIISADVTSSEVTVTSEHTIEGAGFTTGTTSLTGFPIKSSLYNDKVLVAHGKGLTIFTLTNQRLDHFKTIDLGIEAVNIAVHKNIAYIIGYSPKPKLIKVDISKPSTPTIIDNIGLSANTVTGIAVSEEGIFITAEEKGILSL